MAPNGMGRIGVVRPQDMVMLQGVVDQLLKEKDLASGDARAEALAARVIELFQAGIQDPEALKSMAG